MKKMWLEQKEKMAEFKSKNVYDNEGGREREKDKERKRMKEKLEQEGRGCCNLF